ncbi:hypothetical protein JHK82_052601 [Glycine max]|nr:hypothetical protein JHK86_052447 [Glycine max]KAG5082449.1 hypothetical protein JHK84_052487 [Glycine max]KAG5085204.1 hypothetical protein JHK82_052601 [Glycine max]
MADLLSDNGELKTEQISMQEYVFHGTCNASAASQGHSICQERSNSKDVPTGLGLQHAEKGQWSRSETKRSHIIGKKKNRRIEVVHNCFIPQQPQGHRRDNEDPVDTLDKAYASKTNSSRLAPRAFTGKGMDNFPIPPKNRK